MACECSAFFSNDEIEPDHDVFIAPHRLIIDFLDKTSR